MRQPGASRALSSSRAISCVILELVEQPPYAIEVLGGGLVDQMRLAANDQHRAAGVSWLQAARPDATSSAAARVDRFLALADFSAKARLSFVQRQAGEAGVDEIADFGQRRRAASPRRA